MQLLTVRQIKKVCEALFGHVSVLTEHACGYIHNDVLYLSIMGTWFSITEKDGLQPVDLSERHAILDIAIAATENGLFHELYQLLLEEESNNIPKE